MPKQFGAFMPCLCRVFATACLIPGLAASEADTGKRLAEEVRELGWILFSAKSAAGDWDIEAVRPDGSDRRSIASTKEWSEFYPRVSRDGKSLLYRRLPRGETIDGNRHGEQGCPVLATAEGKDPRVLGGPGELPWASWSPDGKEFACLSLKGITFVSAADGTVRRTIPRRGFFQQLSWSPDGQWLCGVSNSFGAAWTVARMNVASGEANKVSLEDNCTPDWFPDGKRLVFSNRSAMLRKADSYGWTQLWMADGDGRDPRLIYAEEGRHIYGGHVSPDGRYVLFTGNPVEDGDPQNKGAPMSLARLSDTPLIVGRCEETRKLCPDAKAGPVLPLPEGWEPCWVADPIAVKAIPHTSQ